MTFNILISTKFYNKFHITIFFILIIISFQAQYMFFLNKQKELVFLIEPIPLI